MLLCCMVRRNIGNVYIPYVCNHLLSFLRRAVVFLHIDLFTWSKPLPRAYLHDPVLPEYLASQRYLALPERFSAFLSMWGGGGTK